MTSLRSARSSPVERVQLRDPLDLVAEELDPDERLLGRRLEFERVAPDAEPGARQRLVVALVLQVDEMAQDGVAPVLATDAEAQHGRAVVHRRAEAVDARHGGHDDHVPSLEQRVGRGMAQPVDLVVAARVLLDVRVRARQVRLGLVVVEVADEVLHGVLREELAELRVQLGGERLVVGQDERRAVQLRDRPGQGRRLARAGRAQQRLVVQTAAQPVDELFDRLRLVPGRFEGCDELQIRHHA